MSAMPGPSAEQMAHLALWHSQFHGGGADDCSTDLTSPCFLLRQVQEVERLRTALAEAEAMFRDADVRLDEQRKMTERAEAQATKIADGLHVWREQCDRTEAVLAEMRGRIEALADECACAMGECYCEMVNALLEDS